MQVNFKLHWRNRKIFFRHKIILIIASQVPENYSDIRKVQGINVFMNEFLATDFAQISEMINVLTTFYIEFQFISYHNPAHISAFHLINIYSVGIGR